MESEKNGRKEILECRLIHVRTSSTAFYNYIRLHELVILKFCLSGVCSYFLACQDKVQGVFSFAALFSSLRHELP